MFSKVTGTLANFLILNGAISIAAAGTSPVVLSRLIVVRFDKARGLALGAALAGMGVSAALAPRLLAGYVAEHGWRAGYQALALVALLAAPFVMAFASERRNIADSSNQPHRPVHSGIELRVALRSGRFWHVAALFICVALGVGGVIVHFIPMLTDAGLPPQRAATLAGLVGVSLIVGRVATGALIDRVFAPHVAAALFAIAALGCFALLWGGIALAPFAAIAIGLAIGAEVDLIGYLVARYFGLRAYGAIYGWQYSAFMIGLAVSPLLAGLIFDSTHSYRHAVLGAGILLSAAVLIASRLGPFPSFDLPRQDEGSNAVSAGQ
jgi:MFS family permease